MVIVFNPLVTWNKTFTYDTYVADARKVATHEMGHAEGLGHSGQTAVMKQGAMSLFNPQTDDENGIIKIYGAYP